MTDLPTIETELEGVRALSIGVTYCSLFYNSHLNIPGK